MPKIAQGIYKRGRTFWYAIQEDGKRKWISLKTDNDQEAIRRASLVKTNAPATKEEKPKADTFKDQVDRYQANKNATGKHVKSTERWSKRALLQFSAHIKNKSAKSVTADDISSFFASLRKRIKKNGELFSPNSVHSYRRALNGFMSWTVTSKLRFDNPAKEVKLGKPEQPAKIKFASREEREAIMEAATTDATRFILYCAFYAGMRFNEICEAKPDWFNLEENYIYIHKQETRYRYGRTVTFVTKNKKNRYVPLSPRFKAFLQTYEPYTSRGAFMLEPTVEHGKGDYRYDFRKPWEKVMGDAAAKLNAALEKKGKLPTVDFDWLTPHIARHTFASLLAQSGTSIYKIAQWIGDGVKVCTDHYAHLSPSDNAINAID